jgi:hypothetical protein
MPSAALMEETLMSMPLLPSASTGAGTSRAANACETYTAPSRFVATISANT